MAREKRIIDRAYHSLLQACIQTEKNNIDIARKYLETAEGLYPNVRNRLGYDYLKSMLNDSGDENKEKPSVSTENIECDQSNDKTVNYTQNFPTNLKMIEANSLAGLDVNNDFNDEQITISGETEENQNCQDTMSKTRDVNINRDTENFLHQRHEENPQDFNESPSVNFKENNSIILEERKEIPKKEFQDIEILDRTGTVQNDVPIKTFKASPYLDKYRNASKSDTNKEKTVICKSRNKEIKIDALILKSRAYQLGILIKTLKDKLLIRQFDKKFDDSKLENFKDAVRNLEDAEIFMHMAKKALALENLARADDYLSVAKSLCKSVNSKIMDTKTFKTHFEEHIENTLYDYKNVKNSASRAKSLCLKGKNYEMVNPQKNVSRDVADNELSHSEPQAINSFEEPSITCAKEGQTECDKYIKSAFAACSKRHYEEAERYALYAKNLNTGVIALWKKSKKS